MKGACHWSTRVKAECDRCGRIPQVLHMPEFVHGWYCAGCCPVCREEQSEASNKESAPPQPPKDPSAPQAPQA